MGIGSILTCRLLRHRCTVFRVGPSRGTLLGRSAWRWGRTDALRVGFHHLAPFFEVVRSRVRPNDGFAGTMGLRRQCCRKDLRKPWTVEAMPSRFRIFNIVADPNGFPFEPNTYSPFPVALARSSTARACRLSGMRCSTPLSSAPPESTQAASYCRPPTGPRYGGRCAFDLPVGPVRPVPNTARAPH